MKYYDTNAYFNIKAKRYLPSSDNTMNETKSSSQSQETAKQYDQAKVNVLKPVLPVYF